MNSVAYETRISIIKDRNVPSIVKLFVYPSVVFEPLPTTSGGLELDSLHITIHNYTNTFYFICLYNRLY